MDRVLIIHHGNCPDGFGAAWWLARHLGTNDLHPASYDQPPPDVTGRDIWIVDFAYPTDVLTAMAAQASTITILDHHQTAAQWIADLPANWDKPASIHGFCDLMELGAGPYVACVDQGSSGVGLVSTYIRRWRGALPPRFLANIEDRDLWRFNYDDTPAVFAAVTSRPYTVDAWDEMARLPHEALVLEGTAVQRFRQKLIDATVDTAFQVDLFGRTVWCAAAPYAIGSDVAGLLALRDPEGFAAYYVPGPELVRFGLRSGPDGADVAALAGTVGGGGHRHASGFAVGRRSAMRMLT